VQASAPSEELQGIQDVCSACEQIAELLLHPNAAVAEASAEVAGRLLQSPAAAHAFATSTPAMANLAAQLKRTVDHSASTQALRPFKRLRALVLADMGLMMSAGFDESDKGAMLKQVVSCLPDLVRAARSDDVSTRLSACGIIAKLTEARHRPSLAQVDVEALRLPRPLGCGARRAGGAPAGSSAVAVDAEDGPSTSAPTPAAAQQAGVAQQATCGPGDTVAWRLRSLVLPILVQLLAEDVGGEVPSMLELVIRDEPVLQRAVADSSALEHLASGIVRHAAHLPEHAQDEDAMDAEATEYGAAAAARGAEAQSSTEWLHEALRCVELLCSCHGTTPIEGTTVESLLCGNVELGGAALTPITRRQEAVCSAAGVAALCKCLQHQDVQLRLAAAQVFRALGRAHHTFKPTSLSNGRLEDALLGAAVEDADLDVRCAACQAVANFIAPTSPARHTLLEKVCLILCHAQLYFRLKWLAHAACGIAPAASTICGTDERARHPGPAGWHLKAPAYFCSLQWECPAGGCPALVRRHHGLVQHRVSLLPIVAAHAAGDQQCARAVHSEHSPRAAGHAAMVLHA
jgi:hypothetical protein